MLNQAGGDRQILAKQLGISPHQLSYVTHSGPGEGVLYKRVLRTPTKNHGSWLVCGNDSARQKGDGNICMAVRTAYQRKQKTGNGVNSEKYNHRFQIQPLESEPHKYFII